MTDPKYVRPRYLDPDNPKSGKKDFYRSPILTEFDKHYTRKASTVFCSRTAADRASVPPPGEALASDASRAQSFPNLFLHLGSVEPDP
jgi:hypothetical protein